MEIPSYIIRTSELAVDGEELQLPRVSGVGIGASHRPAHLQPHSKKGVASPWTGDIQGLQEDEGVFSMSPSQTTLTLTPLCTLMEPAAHDHSHLYDDQTSSSPSTIFSDMQTYDKASLSPQASSPTSFSYASSPETPVSFNFSPIAQYSHGIHDSSSIHQQIPIRARHRQGIARHDSILSAMTDDTEPLSWPSSSYASSSNAPASFPFQEMIFDIKGKGKEREQRALSPELNVDGAPAIHLRDTRLETDENKSTQPMSNVAPETAKASADESAGSQPSSLDSITGLRHHRSHVGLSFSEQRYTPSSTASHSRRQTSFTAGRRRSSSAHSRRRSPTPVPARSRSPHTRATLPRRRGSSIRKLLTIARRGRSSRREMTGSQHEPRVASVTIAAPSATPDSREHLNLSLNPIISPLDPSAPPSPLILPPVQISHLWEAGTASGSRTLDLQDDAGSDSGETSASGSTTIKWSSLAAMPQDEESEAEEHVPGPAVTTIRVTSSTIGEALPASILISPATPSPTSDSPGFAAHDSAQAVPEVTPSSLPTRPPRLKFAGRANTSPSVPQAAVSSTVASGSSAAPISSIYYIRGPSSRRHSNAVVASVFGLEHSVAYSYINTLPPLTRPIPQPDGCGQTPDDTAPLSPAPNTASSWASSPVIPKTLPGDYFSTILPYELQVHVFRTILQLHIKEHDKIMSSQGWSYGVATGGFVAPGGKKQEDPARWVGLQRGIRELVRIGRVSHRWHVLSLDGQLWSTASLSSFPHIPVDFLQRITKSVGPFMKTLDLRGIVGITGPVMMTLVDNVRSAPDEQRLLEVTDADQEGDRPAPVSNLTALLRVTPSSPRTQLTNIQLQGCTSIPTRALHALIGASPLVEVLSLKGLPSVTNATCELIGEAASLMLIKLDLSKCANISANGVEDMIGATNNVVSFKSFSMTGRPRYPIPCRRFPKLKELRVSGLKRVTGQTMFSIGWGLPDLEVLDLSAARTLGDEDLEVFVRWDERFDDALVLSGQVPSTHKAVARDSEPYQRIALTSREMGLNPLSTDKYHRRVTKLRHLSMSCCPLLTDVAAGHLAHSVPKLEFFELGGIGAPVRDFGLTRLFATTKWIRRVDLEDSSEITDEVLYSLIPPPPPPLVYQRRRDMDLASGRTRPDPPPPEPHPGELLEQIVLSYAGNISDTAFLAMIHGCTKLKAMEVDNTRASDQVVKEFAKLCRRRKVEGAEILAVDCRNVTRSTFNEGTGSHGAYLARNRRGYRAWEAKNLMYYDERDRKDVMSGLDAISGTTTVGDECDESRVVVKTFHSWQAVDNMIAGRQKRQKALLKRAAEMGGGTNSDASPGSSSGGDGRSTPRWLQWRSSGAQTPVSGIDLEGGERGCVIM